MDQHNTQPFPSSSLPYQGNLSHQPLDYLNPLTKHSNYAYASPESTQSSLTQQSGQKSNYEQLTLNTQESNSDYAKQSIEFNNLSDLPHSQLIDYQYQGSHQVFETPSSSKSQQILQTLGSTPKQPYYLNLSIPNTQQQSFSGQSTKLSSSPPQQTDLEMKSSQTPLNSLFVATQPFHNPPIPLSQLNSDFLNEYNTEIKQNSKNYLDEQQSSHVTAYLKNMNFQNLNQSFKTKGYSVTAASTPVNQNRDNHTGSFHFDLPSYQPRTIETQQTTKGNSIELSSTAFLRNLSAVEPQTLKVYEMTHTTSMPQFTANPSNSSSFSDTYKIHKQTGFEKTLKKPENMPQQHDFSKHTFLKAQQTHVGKPSIASIQSNNKLNLNITTNALTQAIPSDNMQAYYQSYSSLPPSLESHNNHKMNNNSSLHPLTPANMNISNNSLNNLSTTLQPNKMIPPQMQSATNKSIIDQHSYNGLLNNHLVSPRKNDNSSTSEREPFISSPQKPLQTTEVVEKITSKTVPQHQRNGSLGGISPLNDQRQLSATRIQVTPVRAELLQQHQQPVYRQQDQAKNLPSAPSQFTRNLMQVDECKNQQQLQYKQPQQIQQQQLPENTNRQTQANSNTDYSPNGILSNGLISKIHSIPSQEIQSNLLPHSFKLQRDIEHSPVSSSFPFSQAHNNSQPSQAASGVYQLYKNITQQQEPPKSITSNNIINHHNDYEKIVSSSSKRGMQISLENNTILADNSTKGYQGQPTNTLKIVSSNYQASTITHSSSGSSYVVQNPLSVNTTQQPPKLNISRNPVPATIKPISLCNKISNHTIFKQNTDYKQKIWQNILVQRKLKQNSQHTSVNEQPFYGNQLNSKSESQLNNLTNHQLPIIQSHEVIPQNSNETTYFQQTFQNQKPNADMISTNVSRNSNLLPSINLEATHPTVQNPYYSDSQAMTFSQMSGNSSSSPSGQNSPVFTQQKIIDQPQCETQDNHKIFSTSATIIQTREERVSSIKLSTDEAEIIGKAMRMSFGGGSPNSKFI